MIARFRRRPADDAGFSLTEILVGMSVMSVVMAIATQGLISMFHTTDRAESAATAQNSIQASFEKLDREVRYAERISDPYAVTGGFAVDFVIPDENGVDQCIQLTLPADGGTLMRRQWPQLSRPSAAATAVTPNLISANVTVAADGSKTYKTPFTLATAGTGGSDLDRLTVNMNSTVGLGDLGTTRNYSLVFTAMNTLARAKYPLVCTK